MKNERLFTPEYVQTVLANFTGKNIRMRPYEGNPIITQNSLENEFKVELNGIGVSLYIQNDFYMNKDLKESLSNAVRNLGYYPFQLDKILVEKQEEICVVFNHLLNHLQENLKVQLGFIYYTCIKTLEVYEGGFKINGMEFVVCKP